MKKFSKLLLALGGISAVGAGLAIGTANLSTGTIEKADASSSASLSAIRLELQDETYSLSNYNDPYVHAWNISFTSGSNYEVSDLSGLPNFTVNQDNSIDVLMTWISGDNGQVKHWKWDVPWYISSFTYKYRNFNSGGNYWTNNTTVPTATLGKSVIDAVNNGTVYPTVSSESYTASFTTYTVSFDNGVDTLSGTTVYERTKFTPMDPAVPWKAKTAGWYTDSAKTISFTSGTKITADTTLYGTYSVTAASFASQIMTYESGDKVTSDCSSKYTKAKAYMEVMVDKTNFTSANYPEAYSRWIKWKAANKDTSVDPASNVAQSDKSNVVVLGALAAIAVLAAGGYFFVRKKKNA